MVVNEFLFPNNYFIKNVSQYMNIKEIQAKSVLRKHKKIDSWFVSCYGMNLYRGCTHNCVYCDGRAEGYYVEGEFGQDVSVKTNAVEILRRELDPKNKRVPLKPSFFMVGGGVGDSYQPIETKYQLTQKVLQLLDEYNLPIHILTKSTLVKRDIDIIKQINRKKRAIVSFSFSSVDDNISNIFEPGVPSPSERLDTIKFFKNEGITCGMFFMPVIPFVTDTPKLLEDSIKKAKEAGIDFIVFSGMTLKDGRQKEYFINVLNQFNPELIIEYQNIYKGSKWGAATGEYYNSLNLTFNTIMRKYNIPKGIPPRFYQDILTENDLVIVILERMDYLIKTEENTSPYGYAAYSISQLKEPISTIRNKLRSLNGIGPVTEKIILEILDTGTSSYYEKLLIGQLS